MKKQQVKTSILLFSILLGASYASAVDFNWAEIGNAGNTADDTGYGSVGYEYRIATTEVTNAQYMEFLNAVAKTDTNGLYATGMGGMSGGISRSGTDGNYSYSLKNDDANYANRPVVYVSWYNALRFVNWFNNGQITGSQDATTTEYGAYDMSLQSTNPSSIVRLDGAQYWLPSENEWYKSAYYDPAEASYYDYATGSNSIPSATLPEEDTGNSANYNGGSYIDTTYYTTEVGVYDESESPYGTYDQNGNVWEWNEELIDDLYRGLRGGSWWGDADDLSSSIRYVAYDPINGRGTFGFRVAGSLSGDDGDTIPEPMSIVLMLLSVGGLVLRRAKRA